MSAKLILASASPFRKILLANAGLSFESVPAMIDEREIEMPLVQQATPPEDIALALAEAKALNVSTHHKSAYVIGSDQVLSMQGVLFHKCRTLGEARQRLSDMSGKSHFLDSAVAICHDGNIVWRNVSRAVMTFRTLSSEEIDAYVKEAGDALFQSVGAYQFEGLGIRLFEKIEGDYFTIIGLPMLPLLSALRQIGLIDA